MSRLTISNALVRLSTLADSVRRDLEREFPLGLDVEALRAGMEFRRGMVVGHSVKVDHRVTPYIVGCVHVRFGRQMGWREVDYRNVRRVAKSNISTAQRSTQ